MPDTPAAMRFIDAQTLEFEGRQYRLSPARRRYGGLGFAGRDDLVWWSNEKELLVARIVGWLDPAPPEHRRLLCCYVDSDDTLVLVLLKPDVLRGLWAAGSAGMQKFVRLVTIPMDELLVPAMPAPAPVVIEPAAQPIRNLQLRRPDNVDEPRTDREVDEPHAPGAAG